jgi:hypothetical protein
MDSSATAVYRGTGLTTSGWRANAEPANPGHDTDDMTAECGHSVGPDGEVVLSGETGQNEGFGSHKGDRVPNLDITHVSKPANTRGLPDGHQANQNALTAGRRNTAVHRQPHGFNSRGK